MALRAFELWCVLIVDRLSFSFWLDKIDLYVEVYFLIETWKILLENLTEIYVEIYLDRENGRKSAIDIENI